MKVEMTPSEIIRGLEHYNRELSKKNAELLDLAETKAQAERTFNVKAAQKAVELKKASVPMAIITLMIKGDSEVSLARYDYDIAEATYRACLERIRDIRTAIDTYRSLLSWLKAEMEAR